MNISGAHLKIVMIVSISLLLLSACSKETPQTDAGQDVYPNGKGGYIADFTAMDSPMSITAYGKNAMKAVRDAKDIVLEIDSKTDVHDPDSEIGRLNAQGSFKGAAPLVTGLLTRGQLLSEQTDGTFDVMIRPVTALWKIGDEDAKIPSDEELAAALSKIDFGNITFDGTDITLKNGAAVDIGGIAKGYAADQIAGLFRDRKIKNAMIALSGNIYVLGKNEDGEDWQIGLQDPEHETPYIGVLFVSDESVVTSGSYERFSDIDGVRYGHLFNPATGYPASNDLLSVTIISTDSTLADAYSTALFVMGADRALKFQSEHADQFEAILVTTDKEIICTPGIKDRFELADETGRYHLSAG